MNERPDDNKPPKQHRPKTPKQYVPSAPPPMAPGTTAGCGGCSRKPPSARFVQQSPFYNRELASKLGGIGLCGRPCCCCTWLKRPTALKISIKMAKEQKIALDPDNLNGFCQQIKCCVAFEHGRPEAARDWRPEGKEPPKKDNPVRRFRTLKIKEEDTL